MFPMNRKSFQAVVAFAAFSVACFPAVYVATGLVLPASQTIELPGNFSDAPSGPLLDPESASVHSFDGLTFGESLSLPKGRPGILEREGAYRLTRQPHPWLAELALVLSLLVAGAGWRLRARARPQIP